MTMVIYVPVQKGLCIATIFLEVAQGKSALHLTAVLMCYQIFFSRGIVSNTSGDAALFSLVISPSFQSLRLTACIMLPNSRQQRRHPFPGEVKGMPGN